ncbi:Uncharacterised protein [Mycobacteroides abscessus subsp. massiliense]|nr:Uncharacterised protein [Mycobacteroides abscessus subsp. massiliense]
MIAATTNAPTITYGRAFLSCSVETMPILASNTTTTGTSNVVPNATNMPKIKDRYLSISVAILTPTGVTPAKNLKITGNTKK